MIYPRENIIPAVIILVQKPKEEYLLESTLLSVVGDGGFEPPKLKATDLQSAPFDRSGNLPCVLLPPELLPIRFSFVICSRFLYQIYDLSENGCKVTTIFLITKIFRHFF